jgi:hypothetical protein
MVNISINGTPANIVLESEKTVGEILLAFEAWLTESGFRLSGLVINGTPIILNALEDAFEQEVDQVQTLDIQVSSWSELAIEALVRIREALNQLAGAAPAEALQIKQNWEQGAVIRFLQEQMPDVFVVINKTFAGELESASTLVLIEERLRELTDPIEELSKMDNLIASVAKRLEDLPLDMQTSKDASAAETMQLFSYSTEKLLRIFATLKNHGMQFEGTQIDDFAHILRELLDAYTVKDTVLVGDLAEYETAPRLISMYTAIRDAANTL